MRIDGYCRIYGSSQSENICPIIAKSIGQNGGQSNFELSELLKEGFQTGETRLLLIKFKIPQEFQSEF